MAVDDDDVVVDDNNNVCPDTGTIFGVARCTCAVVRTPERRLLLLLTLLTPVRLAVLLAYEDLKAVPKDPDERAEAGRAANIEAG